MLTISSRPELSPSMLLPVLGTLALLAAAGCGSSNSSDAALETVEVPRNVRVLSVTPADLETYLTISGPTRPLQGTDLSAQESGQVARIPRDKGARVEQGDVLVLLDRDLLGAEMNAARANQELMAYDAERMQQLHEANSISDIGLLQAQTQLREAKARAQIAEIRYNRAAIRAPFAGVVAARYVEPGQLVMPGQTVARVVDPSALVLEAAISEKEVAWVAEGKSATVTFDGAEGFYEGRVHWVSVEADRMTGKFAVEVHIPNPDHVLRAGVIGRARISKAVHEDVILIPRDAVVSRPSGPVAFVVEGDRAVERPLTLGADQGLMVITLEGLAPGDRLIVRGQREIHDGSTVAVQEQADSPDGTTSADPNVVTQDRTVSDHWNTGR